MQINKKYIYIWILCFFPAIIFGFFKKVRKNGKKSGYESTCHLISTNMLVLDISHTLVYKNNSIS
jgi:hypothetical protein